MIRVDALWLAVEPLDMRAGTEAALRRVVALFDAAERYEHVLARRAETLYLVGTRLRRGYDATPQSKHVQRSLSVIPR